MTAWPRWISRAYEVQLREVAPGLYVGGRQAFARALEEGLVFDQVISFTRRISPDQKKRSGPCLLALPFLDGDPIEPRVLNAAQAYVEPILRLDDGRVLLHCQAGLSRSASVAYALLRVGGLSPDGAAFRVHAGYARFPVPKTLASAEAWALDHGASP